MRYRVMVAAAAVLVCTVMSATAAAQPAQLPIQGTLTDTGGIPLQGNHTVAIAIYDVQSGGTALFEETHAVAVDQGAFTVYLGSISALNLGLFSGATLFVGIKVGADPEMTPRLPFGSVPYAAYARETAAVPTGAVMFFDLAACPAGWAELTEARGRAITGLPNGGTLKGTVGTALANVQNRTHAHSVTVPSVTTGNTSVAHTHQIPAHNHQWKDGSSMFNGQGTPIPLPAFPFAAGTASFLPLPTTTDLFTNMSAVASTGGTQQSTSHGHTVPQQSNLASSTASTADVMPYIQLLACRKI